MAVPIAMQFPHQLEAGHPIVRPASRAQKLLDGSWQMVHPLTTLISMLLELTLHVLQR